MLSFFFSHYLLSSLPSIIKYHYKKNSIPSSFIIQFIFFRNEKNPQAKK